VVRIPKKVRVKGHYRHDPRSGKHVRVSSYERMQRFMSEKLSREKLRKMTVSQLRELYGPFLNSSEKRARKEDLIKNIIKRQKKLDTIYRMGPG